jgi:hypothetical protein
MFMHQVGTMATIVAHQVGSKTTGCTPSEDFYQKNLVHFLRNPRTTLDG